MIWHQPPHQRAQGYTQSSQKMMLVRFMILRAVRRKSGPKTCTNYASSERLQSPPSTSSINGNGYITVRWTLPPTFLSPLLLSPNHPPPSLPLSSHFQSTRSSTSIRFCTKISSSFGFDLGVAADNVPILAVTTQASRGSHP